MKQVLLSLCVLLFAAAAASAQRVTGHVGGFYQSKLKAPDGSDQSLHQWGVSAGVQFEPFYPWPIYLETGMDVVMAVTPSHTADAYRLEVPLDVTWQWEPGPNFSIGPYLGAYGSCYLWVSPSYGEKAERNTFGWGLMGGVSVRPKALLVNVGYYRDMMPIRKDTVGQDFFRIGHGIRVSLAWCF